MATTLFVAVNIITAASATTTSSVASIAYDNHNHHGVAIRNDLEDAEEEKMPLGLRINNDQRELQQQAAVEVEEDVQTYVLWDASKFPYVLEEWKTMYPDFIRVTTAQDLYGLPAAGDDGDCPFYPAKGCPNYIFTIQDFVVHTDDSESSKNLPEVFWSGCLHGNERVGPSSVMEAASLLLESALCESLPRSKTSSSSFDEELQQAKVCRRKLRQKGVDDFHRKWLARLVSTRRIVVVPTANALGYYRDAREENTIDPNRDFPYDLTDPTQCMQTIAGRTINEIYREHMFQLALTFHAGMEVVSYEWYVLILLDVRCVFLHDVSSHLNVDCSHKGFFI